RADAGDRADHAGYSHRFRTASGLPGGRQRAGDQDLRQAGSARRRRSRRGPVRTNPAGSAARRPYGAHPHRIRLKPGPGQWSRGRALSTVPSDGAVDVSADGSLDPVRGHRDSVALSAVGGESGDDLDDDHIDADDRDQEQDEQADADDREHPADETETDDGDDSDDEQIERLGSVVADER